MDLSPIRSAYLAGPIDDIGRAASVDWRVELGQLLAADGVACFNPASAWHVDRDLIDLSGRAISAIDFAAVGHCDLLIAKLDGPGKAFMTMREVERHIGRGPTVAWVSADDIHRVAFADVQVVLANGVHQFYEHLVTTVPYYRERVGLDAGR